MVDAALPPETGPARRVSAARVGENARRGASLAEILDRLLDCGLALEGEAVVGLAGVDLFCLELKAMLASVDTASPEGRPNAAPSASSRPGPALPKPGAEDPAAPATARTAGEKPALVGTLAQRPQAAREGGLARLVLALAELLHEVLERQALRRMQRGRLSAAEVEGVGAALYAQALEIERLRREFAPGKAEGEPLFSLRLCDRSL